MLRIEAAKYLTDEMLRMRLADMRERLKRGPSWAWGDMSWLDLGVYVTTDKIEGARAEQRTLWEKHLSALITYGEESGAGC